MMDGDEGLAQEQFKLDNPSALRDCRSFADLMAHGPAASMKGHFRLHLHTPLVSSVKELIPGSLGKVQFV